MTAWIRRAAPDPEAPRMLKVRIPVRYHLALQARRLRRGESLSSTVHAAVEQYLAAHRRARPRV